MTNTKKTKNTETTDTPKQESQTKETQGAIFDYKGAWMELKEMAVSLRHAGNMAEQEFRVDLLTVMLNVEEIVDLNIEL